MQIITLTKDQIVQRFVTKSTGGKILNLILILAFGGLGFLIGKITNYAIEKKDFDDYDMIQSLHYSRYMIFYITGLFFIFPYFIPVNRRIPHFYPLAKWKSFTLNLIMDITGSWQVYIMLFIIIGYQLGTKLTLLPLSLSLAATVINVLLGIRIIQNIFLDQFKKLPHVLMLIPFTLYLATVISKSESYFQGEFYIDHIALIVLLISCFISDSKVRNLSKSKGSSKIYFKNIWLNMLFKNKTARSQFISLIIIAFVMNAVFIVFKVFFPGEEMDFLKTNPALLWISLPIFISTGLCNLWIIFPSLFKNLETRRSKLKDFYSIYLKIAITVGLLHFANILIACYAFDLAPFWQIVNYFTILIINIFGGMFFSLHHSKKISTKGSGRFFHNNFGGIFLSIIGIGIAVLTKFDLGIYTLLFLIIPIFFHLCLKEDFQEAKHKVYQNIHTSL
ncbi:MAG: hypothetical protein ACEPOW_07870 [Bacteroidales bacterium]